MSARALLIGIDPDDAATLRLRDRIIAAGIPLVLVPLIAVFLHVTFQPAGNSPWAFLLLVAFSMIVTLPAFPIVVLASYWFSRRGLIGALPFLGAGAAFGTLATGIAVLSVSTEISMAWDEALMTLASWVIVGAVYASIAWLSLVLLRIDLYFDISERAGSATPQKPPRDER